MSKIIALFFTILLLNSCDKPLDKEKEFAGIGTKMQMTKLDDDFSFRKKWEYPEGVYRNEFGQLSCDGICPPEIDDMMDEKGKIFPDSLSAFYKVVDTTHQFYSLESEAWTYEWAGSHYATATQPAINMIVCETEPNVATHSRLIMKFISGYCIPKIEVLSISKPDDKKTYDYQSGKIYIDQSHFKKGILKAKFDFTFKHPENPKQIMYWKGKIFAPIVKDYIKNGPEAESPNLKTEN
ncbi:hypothetical protein [Soonwooa sp.]|uniref:hypothetical protein n=1 Tax=Soonwooa sp. TaxID=1938592 RepID=UPI0026291FFC|nr:hypothetical protein [Soonwooa sp.]